MSYFTRFKVYGYVYKKFFDGEYYEDNFIDFFIIDVNNELVGVLIIVI
jgi:hypothetical protein